MEIKDNKYHAQTLVLEDRKRLTLTGVIAVDCFTDQKIRLTVQSGKLLIGGEKLKINGFSEGTGDFSCEGVISSVNFLSRQEKFIKRLFK